MNFKDYIGKTVNARYAVEHNVGGADVPVMREGEVTPYLDDEESIFLDTEDGPVYPFDYEFELLTPKP